MSAQRRTSNRGFWLVIGTMAAAGVLLVVLILLFRPQSGGEPLARSNLRDALAAARSIGDEEGSFAGVSALRLREARPDLLFIDGNESSNDPGVISVFASPSLWAGAARSTSGTCYWIRATVEGSTTYGTGADCTGEAARGAKRTAWPASGS